MKKVMLLASILVSVLVLSLTGCKAISRLADSGGTVFIVEVVTNDPNRADIVSRAIRITESRLNAAGLDGEVAKSASGDDRIEVKIYGSHDLDILRTFLFTPNRLELKKVVSPPNPSPMQTFPSKEEGDIAAAAGQQVLQYSESEGPVRRFLIVEKEPIVTGEHIRSGQAVSRTGSDFDYQISFTLRPDGAVRFGEWTGKNINNYLAVVLDDKVQSAAYIKTQISDAGEISGRFSKTSAEEIAMHLNSGYMPADLKVIEEKPFK